MKQLMEVVVKGEKHTYSFLFQGDPKYLAGWLDDGLEVHVIRNIVPEWAVNLGLAKPFMFFQDIFNFRNPFR